MKTEKKTQVVMLAVEETWDDIQVKFSNSMSIDKYMDADDNTFIDWLKENKYQVPKQIK